ncbi:MAG TPA: GAP family protein [Solirubrobacterales bacterium]|nr:GAP family protein [Solirubrobacterales bacterium]
MGDVGTILALALLAMLNPTLLAAVTVMMLLPETKKLMFGYLLGAYLASISVGLLIVFSLHDTGATNTARASLTPAEDLVFGAIALIVGIVLWTGRADELRERRRRRKEGKKRKEPWPQRLLGRGSARITFAVGVLLSFPGASYLVGLDRIARLDAGAAAAVLLVVVFCVIQLVLLELPLIGYVIAPEWTQGAVSRFREWIALNGVRVAGKIAIAIGVLLLLRGTLELLL